MIGIHKQSLNIKQTDQSVFDFINRLYDLNEFQAKDL